LLFTRERVIEAAARETSDNRIIRKAMSSQRLYESATKAALTDRFDIFLSHARVDEDVVYGTKLELEAFGVTVYVDWINDPQLDRSQVNVGTADTLRARMRQCRGLLYVHSENSLASVWMPWELGYFDGYEGRAAIIPVVEASRDQFTGLEYLGLYPYIDAYRDKKQTWRLWVNKPGSRSVYAPLDKWLDNIAAMRERAPW
jgi:hypothetical protein